MESNSYSNLIEELGNHSGKLLQPAFMIVLLTAATYFWGWSYVDSYFERLGLHHDSLDFPTTFYLGKAFWPAMMGVFLIIISFVRKDPSEWGYLSALRGNIPIFAIIAFAISKAIDGEFDLVSIGSVLIAITLLASVFVLTIQKIPFTNRALKFGKRFPIIAMLLVFLGNSLVAIFIGELHAVRMIEGKRQVNAGLS